jgi:DNA polymerase III delta prime subunit
MPRLTLLLHKEVFPFLNIGLFVNSIKVIRSLSIENTSELNTGPIEIVISADLPCLDRFSYHIEDIPAGKDIKVLTDNLKINREYISKLSEVQKSIITIEVLQYSEIIIREEVPIVIHPIEFFGGFHVLPELIASYVTPNHPYVYHIKRKAIEILESQTLRTAFEGYQSNNPERVLQMMSAIYTAIQSEDIIYSALPPSYEIVGQRLRLLSTIESGKFGNCIDLSLLFAACFEAIDLNPIIVITKGHAFVGCWLHDSKFPEVIIDDKSAITKRLAKGIRELAVIEATIVCKGSDNRFSEAMNFAEALLVEKDEFLLAVDVKRARSIPILPLPLLVENGKVTIDGETIKRKVVGDVENAFSVGNIYFENELDNIKRPMTKQKVWERKLLDLSLRNNLLNLRMTKNILQLVDIDVSHLEDTLADGKSFKILPAANAEIIRKYNIFNGPIHHSSLLYQTANDELKHNRLLTYYHQLDLDIILSYMYKNAKQAIEENGSSTLYLAVGLLKWFDKKMPDQPRYAPVLLIPVELSRRSINSKFTLKSREEESMINITLLEFLRQEFELNLSALETLPTDDKGVDVLKVMAILRRAVMQLKGWDVEEQLVLGNFSFSKLILWKDIVVHQEALLKSEIVKSLVDGRLSLDGIADDNDYLDAEKMHPSKVSLPIPVDVSQMDAIVAAQQGKSFILHGPPGTGKSQTITNIIADALYNNKRVLFVAAKKAALDVVHKRMESVGLAPFSLELHSNKSSKPGVLAQLSKSLEVVKRAQNNVYSQEAERLQKAKLALSEYVNALHQVHPSGLSLHNCITALEEYRETSFLKIKIDAKVISSVSSLLRQQWQDWLPRYQAISNKIIHPKKNPLNQFTINHYTLDTGVEITLQTNTLLTLLERMVETTAETIKAVQFPFALQQYHEWKNFQEVLLIFKEMPDVNVNLCIYLSSRDNIDTLEKWSGSFLIYQQALEKLLINHERSVLKEDLIAFETQWKQAQQLWFLPKWFKKNKLKNQLLVFRKGKFENDLQVEELFSLYNSFKDSEQAIMHNRFNDVLTAIGKLHQDEKTDVKQIMQHAQSILKLKIATEKWGKNSLYTWATSWKELGIEYTSEIIPVASKIIVKFIALANEVHQQIDQYKILTGLFLGVDLGTQNWLKNSIGSLKIIQSQLQHLKTWMNYANIRREGLEMNLQWLIKAFEEDQIFVHNMTETFCNSLYSSISENIIEQREPLSFFNKNLYEQKINLYRKVSREFLEITRQDLVMKLAERIPNTTIEAMQSSEIGILQRAIKNKGRGLSIRKLFDQIPTLLPRIAPCMLMSPISVAQYFDVDTRHFDLVIFDEASQLPTCEAVSALARAKQAIIVGDPRQMPPTSFFNTNKIDEENMEVEDLESILDDCLSLSIPSRYLLRHYRSKHESLIAFSNANYYDNKLLTFPSADDMNRKVKYHHIKGYYDKGKTRQNKFEAVAIVEFIKSHLQDERRRKMSIGVVTFSQTQQNTVEDKLQELFMANPELERFAEECNEPLFVKNLENVQGDERDIILFSVCYAPDENGKLSMNFGPLNRDGGWRRLNVAVTRSRNEMHVFATLKADEVDLSRTSAEGVVGLKAFLNFAENGHLALRVDELQKVDNQGIVRVISEKLAEKGFQTKNHIGTSGFKIDIGVIHPEKPEVFILGIVTDGKYYHDAQTSNDRETILPSMLNNLGWNLMMVWSMDWYYNAEEIIEGIIERINNLKNQLEEGSFPFKESIDVIEETPELSNLNIVHAVEATVKRKPYAAHDLIPMTNGSFEAIYEFQNRKIIKEQMLSVIKTEAPISKGLLYKKVLQAWNTSRVGSRLDRHLENIISELEIKKVVHHQPFYWSETLNVSNMDWYRSNDTERRNIEDIAPEELQVAIIEAVMENLSIEENELFRHIARMFGFSKVGKQIDNLLMYSLELAVKEGKLQRENGRVKV